MRARRGRSPKTGLWAIRVLIVGPGAAGLLALASLALTPFPSRAQEHASPSVATSDLSQATSEPAAAPSARTFVIPQGTKILLSLSSAVNTKSAKPGDGVYLVSTFPVVVGSHVLVPAGVYVQGSVDHVIRPGHVKGRAQVGMHFTSLIFPNGSVVEIPGVVNSLPGSAGAKVKDGEGTIEQPGNKGRDVGTVLKGAAIGAEGGVIGGAATGNLGAGVGYGSLAGALAGGIYTLFQRGDDVNIPQGSIVEMVLQRPLVLQEENLKQDSADPKRYFPAAQQQPLPKPRGPGMLCPPGALGCN